MFKIAEKAHRKSNPGWNPGLVPCSNPGSDPGSNPGSDPGFILSVSPITRQFFEILIQPIHFTVWKVLGQGILHS